MEHIKKYRIESIDLLRGVVMILMALDHARVFFGYGSFFSQPLNLNTTTPFLFFTRWITHFCAPVFVFLAGTSAFLYGSRKKNIKNVSWFLFTRGVWLIFVELIIVNFGWTFDIMLSFHILAVIWTIGISMVCLSAMVFLPKWFVFAIGMVLVVGHNLLDFIKVEGTTITDYIWYLLHQPQVVVLGPNSGIDIHYPVLPWIGLIALGYIFGTLYHKEFEQGRRRTWLLWMGVGAILFFFLLRVFNFYGDSSHWNPQRSIVFSIMSFINTTKYPPSLLFLLMTIGPSFLFLYRTENVKNKITSSIILFGRVPFFFYILHIYVFHLLAMLAMIFVGRSCSDYILTATSFFIQSTVDFGFHLYIVYFVWICVLILLFPLCKWYNEYKTNNRSKWWLSYL